MVTVPLHACGQSTDSAWACAQTNRYVDQSSQMCETHVVSATRICASSQTKQKRGRRISLFSLILHARDGRFWEMAVQTKTSVSNHLHLANISVWYDGILLEVILRSHHCQWQSHLCWEKEWGHTISCYLVLTMWPVTSRTSLGSTLFSEENLPTLVESS